MNSIKKIRDSEMEYFFSTLFARSEEHTSELQSQSNLVCRLLLEKKKKIRVCVHTADLKLITKLRIFDTSYFQPQQLNVCMITYWYTSFERFRCGARDPLSTRRCT